nr:MAG TPA: hypothetical protein [Caudoviricetes sp.]
MLRRGLRRRYLLVGMRVLGSRLNVFTGKRVKAASRAGARGRAGAGLMASGALETLRQLAFALVNGLPGVSRGRRAGDGGEVLDMRRGGRGLR